ncbi:MAG: S8 family serine peptidase [Elusimicrobia bacterium]|nr:S8 family serine peptidase [Elusimicrobiota bacterium]
MPARCSPAWAGYRRLCISAALLVLACASAQAFKVEKLRGPFGPAGAKGAPIEIEVAAGEALIQFEDSVSSETARGTLRASGFEVIQLFEPNWLHIRLPKGMSVAAALSILRGIPGVHSVAPNRVYRALRTPNDPGVPSQWHLSTVNAFSAWEYDTGSSSMVTIAVLDSGIDTGHPELSGKLIGTSQKWTFDARDYIAVASSTGTCSHGTMVAGVAAATTNNGVGIAGMSWGARLISLDVFECDCTSCSGDCNNDGCGTLTTTIRKAIDYARTTILPSGVGRLIINMSLGASTACGAAVGGDPGDPLLPTAVTNAVNAGIVLVAATGNILGGCYAVMSPANCGGVIPVGATNQNNTVASFSCQGAELAANGVAAPGVGIYTTAPHSGYASENGTSFSSPLTAGIAALILSAKPSFTPAEVKNTLRGSAVSIGGMSVAAASPAPQGNASGAGLVNAFRAMRLAVNGTLVGFEGDERAIAFPNPFRPSEHDSATITVPIFLQGTGLKIHIFTVDGQLVRDLGSKLSWDGKNDHGAQVASGTYIFIVKTDKGSQRGRVAVIR